MAHTLLVSGSNGGYAQAGVQSFAPLGLCFNGSTPSTTEANTQIIQRTAGVLSQLSANVQSFTNAVTIQLRKGGATQTTPSIAPAGVGITTDSTHTVNVAAADKWNYILSANTSTFSLFSCVFAATTNTVCRFVTYANTAVSTTGTPTTNNYTTLMGQAAVTTTALSANAGITIQKAGTLKFLAVNVSANTVGAGSTFNTAKGSTASGPSIALNGAGTGVLEDTTNVGTVVAADVWNYKITIGVSGALSYFSTAVDFISTSGYSIQGAGIVTGTGFTKSAVRSQTLGGDILVSAINLTETWVQDTVQDTYLYSNTYANCKTFVSADIWQLRAGAAQADSISVSVVGTGNTGDTTHTYTAAAADNMNWQIQTGSTTGTRTYTAVWVHATLATAAAAVVYPRFFTTKPTQPMFANIPPMFAT